jgi:hypothetical protein
LAVVVVGVGWPGVSAAQTTRPDLPPEPARELEVGYAGWQVEDNSRHQVMAGLVFHNRTPVSVVLRATGSWRNDDRRYDDGLYTSERDGWRSLATLGVGARLEGRLPRATMSLQALIVGGGEYRDSKSVTTGPSGRTEYHHQSFGGGFFGDVGVGLSVRMTDRVSVFGTVGAVVPLPYPVAFAMLSTTAGVSVSWNK